MKTPIKNGVLQGDIDFAGFHALNFGFQDANTVTAGAIGLVGDGVTDNTAALQAWINSVEAAKVNSTLLVPDGIYIFSGALQDGGRRNAQILLPSNDITDPPYSITIKGYHPLSYIPWPGVSMPSPKGPIFRSTLATGGGTQPSFIGGMGPPGSIVSPDLSFMTLCLENMIFQTVQDPLISCVNLSRYSVVELAGDVIIMAGTKVGSNDTVQPTHSGSRGLILPPNNSGMVQRGENVNVSNFYTGVAMGELTHIVNLACEMCIYALEFGFAYHITLIDRIVDWWCKNGINMTDTHPFQVRQYDVERGADAQWFTRVNDIDDAGNKAVADITWWTVKTGIGAQNVFTVNGGSGIKLRRLGGAY